MAGNRRTTGGGQRALGLDGRSPGAQAESLDVEVEGVVYEGEGSFAVLNVAPANGALSLRATGPLAGLSAGETVRLRGRHVRHHRHGPQFEVETWESIEPRTVAGIERFLASGLVPGVGKKMASTLVAHFGAETLDVICERPHLLRQVRGVGKKKANGIYKAVSTRRNEAEALSFLRAYGVGTALARRVLEQYGEEARRVIVEDPYRLAREVRGVGFRTADRIGRELGIDVDSPSRVEAAILHVMGEARDEGHAGLPRPELVDRVAELEVAAASISEGIERLRRHGGVEVEGELLYLPVLRGYEALLARELATLAALEPEGVAGEDAVERICREHRLAPEQGEALRGTAQSRLIVITGGPGTGKTTTLEAVVALHEQLGRRVLLAAPTGRAARRLTEVAGRSAQTIHRLLEYSPTQGFQRRRDNPIDADMVIIDEASMLDLPLAYRLLSGLRRGSSLVLVGDVDQLPSVGVGTILRDLIGSGVVPVVRLRTVFRQAERSQIVQNAHRVNRGEPPRAVAQEGGIGQSDFYVIRADEPSKALDVIERLICERMPKAFGLDPLRDVQVLAPMYRGTLGCHSINERLRERLSERSTRPGLRGFCRGDKVMQFRNDYERDVFNGDVGWVDLAAADKLIVDYDGHLVEYDQRAAEELQLAYCITIHKSQGSEYPAVVVVIHKQHQIMLARNLLYTAITRGKRLVVLVGSPEAMARAAQTERLVRRYGLLEQRLRDATPPRPLSRR